MQSIANCELELLRIILADPNTINIYDMPDDLFQDNSYCTIYGIIKELVHHGISPDSVMIYDGLLKAERSDLITMFAGITPSHENIKNAPYHVERLIEYKRKIEIKKSIMEAMELLDDASISALDLSDQTIEKISQAFRRTESRKSPEMKNLFPGYVDDIEERVRQKESGHMKVITTGFYELDNLMGPILPGELVIVAARPGGSKAQPLDAKIKTIDGWKTMGEMRVGDKIASIDGQESVVEGVYPQGEKDIYRFTFSDGRSMECCEDHLWTVHRRDWVKPQNRTTKQLIQSMKAKRNKNRLWIDLCDGSFGEDKDIIVDPWLLGFLIGDGCFTRSTILFSTSDSEILEKVKKIVSPSMMCTYAGQYDYRIRGIKHTHDRTPLWNSLNTLGLIGANSYNKFIPENYLNASTETRIKLLNGLVASDGSISANGCISYSTSSKKLCEGVLLLARSLGFIATCRERKTSFSYKGEKKEGAVSYKIFLLCENDMKNKILMLPRHVERIHWNRTIHNRLTISSIEFSRRTQAQCIYVSHPSHLYITDNYVVTHNTSFATHVADHVAVNNFLPTVFFSLEMTQNQMIDRFMALKHAATVRQLRSGDLDSSKLAGIIDAINFYDNIPIYIYDGSTSASELHSRIRREVVAHGAKFIVIDYVGLISGLGSDGKGARWEKVGEESRELKRLALELKTAIMPLVQLGRQSQDVEPSIADLKDSASLESDADRVLLLYPKGEYHPGDRYKQIAVKVGKNRHGDTGEVNLQFDGPYTRFVEEQGVHEKSTWQDIGEK